VTVLSARQCGKLALVSERLDGFFYRPDEAVPASLAFEGPQVEPTPVREKPLTDFLAFRLDLGRAIA
jgi:hypothetical protein